MEQNFDKKIMWLSNAGWCPTGYGDQTGIFLPLMKEDGYDMSVTAFWGLNGGIINWNGIPHFPPINDGYGRDAVIFHAKASRCKTVISLMDAWVLEDIAQEFKKAGLKWWAWFPIDGEPVQDNVLSAVHYADKLIPMSKHGVKMLQAAGIAEDRYHYIPHGIDTDVLHPMENKKELRKQNGLPEDAYIVGTVAANKGVPSRKAFDEMLMAFREFKNNHPDAVFYIHTDPVFPAGEDLLHFMKFAGLELGTDVIFPEPFGYKAGYYTKEKLAELYNCMDVFLLPSKGEGFGIPILEAQACGTPVIVGEWSSMGELCGSGRIILKSQAERYYNHMGAFWYVPHVDAIVKQLEIEYKAPSNRDKARNFAVKYDYRTVYEKYWKPLLKTLEANDVEN